MAGYDPKQKRAHSPTDADGPAPVDELLGESPPEAAPEAEALASDPVQPAAGVGPATEVVSPDRAPSPARRGEAPPMAPPAAAAAGPDPRTVAAVVAAVLAVVWFWRHRRCGSR